MNRVSVFLFPALAVEGFVHLAEVFVGHMRVDLCRCNVGVAEECLYAAQVGAVLE